MPCQLSNPYNNMPNIRFFPRLQTKYLEFIFNE